MHIANKLKKIDEPEYTHAHGVCIGCLGADIPDGPLTTIHKVSPHTLFLKLGSHVSNYLPHLATH